MGYTVNGNELETDDQGYLLEPDFGDEVVQVIAAAEEAAEEIEDEDSIAPVHPDGSEEDSDDYSS